MKPTKNIIPPKYHQDIMDQTANGLSQHAIVDWLLTNRGYTCHRSSVQRLQSKIKKERREMAQQAIQLAVSQTVVSDFEILAENTRILREIRDAAMKDGSPLTAIKAVNELKNHISLKLGASNSADDKAVDASLDFENDDRLFSLLDPDIKKDN